MARAISISSPSANTDIIVQDLKTVPGILELQVFRGVSVDPPGDVIKLAVPNALLNKVMRLLDGHNAGRENGISLSTSDISSYLSPGSSSKIERDNNEATWEEMVMAISDDSNTSFNTLLIMFISGVLAAIGLATSSLHIVVGGMLVAPGFMPITRVALGLIAKHKTWRYGSIDFVKGYLSLILGAALTTLLLKVMGEYPLPGSSSYYATDKGLIAYWTTITLASILASGAASLAGALLIATKKSVFTSGVMIGLALVPTAAIIGMGLINGDFALMQKALLRFVIDVVLVFILSAMVFAVVKIYLHKRGMRL